MEPRLERTSWAAFMSYHAVTLFIPAYVALQAWAAIAWTGGWRWAALAPLPVLVVLAAEAVHAHAQGASLWPLMLILFPVVGFLYLGLAAFARLVVRLSWRK